MTFNIADFNSKLHEHGVSKSNLFFARIQMPRALQNELNGISIIRDLEFYCKSVQLPELDVTTADIQQQGFGAITRRPQSMTFPVLPTTFMVDSNFGVMKLFHRWTQAIVNYDRSGGNYGSVNNAMPFEMGYKDEYQTTMQVAVFSQNSRQVEYVYEFAGLYPVNVGNVAVAWENAAEVLTLPIGFTYDQLKVTGSEAGRVQSVLPGSNSGKLLRWFSSINNTVSALESITKPQGVQDAINNLINVNTIYNSFK